MRSNEDPAATLMRLVNDYRCHKPSMSPQRSASRTI